jgi:hypothetical protein
MPKPSAPSQWPAALAGYSPGATAPNPATEEALTKFWHQGATSGSEIREGRQFNPGEFGIAPGVAATGAAQHARLARSRKPMMTGTRSVAPRVEETAVEVCCS